MKKNNLFVIIVIVCISLLIYVFFPQPPCSLTSFDKRAVWVTYQELSELSYESKASFQNDFYKVIREIKKHKNNTVIVQVRPFADALYDSKVFPLSQVITQKRELSFDPLNEMVEIAHEEGLYIEAWVNPYRISLNEKTYHQFMQSKYHTWLNDDSLTIHYGSYQYILNPASQQVRQLIVDGVKEIVNGYQVDGVHFDDYFYVPGTHGSTTKEDRFDNVNLLIKDVYQNIKSIKKDVSFGISSQGNYENCLAEGVDVDTWLKEEGYIDYLMPQIYWSNQYGIDQETTMFKDRAKLFASLKRSRHVQLYAGLALYKSGEDIEIDQGWKNSTHNISDQVQILYENGYDGYSLFKYSSFENKDAIKEMDELLRVHP